MLMFTRKNVFILDTSKYKQLSLKIVFIRSENTSRRVFDYRNPNALVTSCVCFLYISIERNTEERRDIYDDRRTERWLVTTVLSKYREK